MANENNLDPAQEAVRAAAARRQAEAQANDTEFATEFDAAAEQNAAPTEQKSRPDKKDDRGNHR